MEIDAHVACAMSGLTADARTMVEHARVTAQVSAPPRAFVRLQRQITPPEAPPIAAVDRSGSRPLPRRQR